jgi:hypothetical protein
MKTPTCIGALAALLGIAAIPSLLNAQARGLLADTAQAHATACTMAYGGPATHDGFIVSPLGEILARPTARVHERDAVAVGVFAEASLQPSLIVRRESDFRSPDEVRILGEAAAPAGLSADRGPVHCATRWFSVRNFGGPQGKVVIAAMTADKGDLVLGRFDFPVALLYNGAFGLGPVTTPVADESFTLYRPHGSTLPAGDSIVVAVDRGTSRMMWVLTYTHYLLGPRDVLADPLTGHRNEFYRHLNLTIGVAPEALGTNAFVGLSVDFLPFPLTVTGGVHFGRRTVLDPTAHIAAGDTVSGDRGGLPLVHRWDHGFFLGASLDFRAMLQVFTLAAKTGLGKS